MKKRQNAKPESFIRKPVYPGGAKAFNEFIRQELKYPDIALENKIEGTVSVTHDVDANGEVSEVRLKHGIGYGCDEEAIRIVKLLKYDKKKYRGMRVVFHNITNIHFKLIPSAPTPDNGPVFNYSIKVNDHEQPEKVVYNIIINPE